MFLSFSIHKFAQLKQRNTQFPYGYKEFTEIFFFFKSYMGINLSIAIMQSNKVTTIFFYIKL